MALNAVTLNSIKPHPISNKIFKSAKSGIVFNFLDQRQIELFKKVRKKILDLSLYPDLHQKLTGSILG